MTEDRVRDLLREMRDEPVPADSLRRVRLAVTERTAKRRFRWWYPVATLAAASAALALFVIERPAPVEPPPRIAAGAPPAPAVGVRPPATPEAERVPARVVRRERRPARPVPEVANVVIRIETPDPDVVILLLD